MSFAVSQATPEDWAASCRLLSQRSLAPARVGAARRYRDLLASGTIDPAGLFIARDEYSQVQGAMLVQVQPGALGLAWPPHVNSGRDHVALEDALVAAACNWLRSRGVKVCQAFGPAGNRGAMAPLARHGLRIVTQLTFLRRTFGDSAAFPTGGGVLHFDRVGPGNAAAFVATLLATYDGSRDCPEATGSRTQDELVQGLGQSAGDEPARWFLVFQDRNPVGVVLLDDAVEASETELTYLGLIPRTRGHGWSHELVRFAMQLAAASPSRALTVSVDLRNEPALRLYLHHDFREFDRQDVFLASWSGSS